MNFTDRLVIVFGKPVFKSQLCHLQIVQLCTNWAANSSGALQLGPCYCARASSGCQAQGLLSRYASRVTSNSSGFWSQSTACRAHAPVVVTQGLVTPPQVESSLEQGLNLCPLHWQADT